MRLLAEKINKLKTGWNERALTEADFYRLCRRFKVSVTEMPLSVGGFYYRVGGRDFIAVNSRLAGAEKLAVLFHELGHFLFHAPDSGATANFHRVGRRPVRNARPMCLHFAPSYRAVRSKHAPQKTLLIKAFHLKPSPPAEPPMSATASEAVL
jgi:hypothetical protein